MKKLIQAVEAQRRDVECAAARVEDEDPQTGDQLREAAYLVRVLISIMRGTGVLKAFGAPGDWGYGTPIGDGLFEALKEAKPDPYRWHQLEGNWEDLPDAETQVLIYDGERHHLAYVGDDDIWCGAVSDEPLMFEVVRWRHLDDGAP